MANNQEVSQKFSKSLNISTRISKSETTNILIEKIGHFSVDEHDLDCDDRQLRIFSPISKLSNIEFKNFFADYDEDNGRLIDQKLRRPGCLDLLSNYILKQKRNPDRISLKNLLPDVDAVCLRGTLIQLAKTPFSDDWFDLAAVKFRGILFLMKLEGQTYQLNDRVVYASYRFEKFVSKEKSGPYQNGDLNFGDLNPSVEISKNLDDSETKIEDEKIINCFDRFYAVYRSKLSKGPKSKIFSIFYSAEIDCVDGDGKFNELKTITKRNLDRNFQSVAFRWWIQSFFAKIDTIQCAIKNENEIAHLTAFNVENDLNIDDGKKSICLNALYEILAYVDENTTESWKQEKVSVFQFDPKKKILTKIKEVEDDVLPEGFIAQFGGDD